MVNRKLLREDRKPIVGPLSHKLHLDVSHMIRDSAVMSSIVDSVHPTIRDVCRLKSSAV